MIERSGSLKSMNTVWFFTSCLVDNGGKVAAHLLRHDLARHNVKSLKEVARLFVMSNLGVSPTSPSFKNPATILHVAYSRAFGQQTPYEDQTKCISIQQDLMKKGHLELLAFPFQIQNSICLQQLKIMSLSRTFLTLLLPMKSNQGKRTQTCVLLLLLK